MGAVVPPFYAIRNITSVQGEVSRYLLSVNNGVLFYSWRSKNSNITKLCTCYPYHDLSNVAKFKDNFDILRRYDVIKFLSHVKYSMTS